MVCRRAPARVQRRRVVRLVPDVRARAVRVVVLRAAAVRLRVVAAERVARSRRHRRRRHRAAVCRRHARVARHARIRARHSVQRHRVLVRRPRRRVRTVARAALRDRHRHRRFAQARARPARERVARSRRRVQREARRLDRIRRRVRVRAGRQRAAVRVVRDRVFVCRPRRRVAAVAVAARRDRHRRRRAAQARARPARECVAAARRVLQRNVRIRHFVRVRVLLTARQRAAVQIVRDRIAVHRPCRRQRRVLRDVHRVGARHESAVVRLRPARERVPVLRRVLRPFSVFRRIVLDAVRLVVRHRLRLVVDVRREAAACRQAAAVERERQRVCVRREDRLQRHVAPLARHRVARVIRAARGPVAHRRLRRPVAERVARLRRVRQFLRRRRFDRVAHRVRRAARQRSAVRRHVEPDRVRCRRPLRLQRHVAPVVVHTVAACVGRIHVPRSQIVRGRLPSCEIIAVQRRRRQRRRRFVIVCHLVRSVANGCAAVRIKCDRVVRGRPFRVDRRRRRDVPHMRARARCRVILRAAAVRVPVVAAERVARLRRLGRRRRHRAAKRRRHARRSARSALLVQRYRIRVRRPCRRVASVARAARRDRYRRRRARKSGSRPARERVARLHRVVQRDRRRRHVVARLVRRAVRQRAALQIIADRIRIQRPLRRVFTVARAALGDRYARHRLRQSRAVPARERISRSRRRVQRERRRLDRIRRRVRGRTALQLVCDRVGRGRPLRLHLHVAVLARQRLTARVQRADRAPVAGRLRHLPALARAAAERVARSCRRAERAGRCDVVCLVCVGVAAVHVKRDRVRDLRVVRRVVLVARAAVRDRHRLRRRAAVRAGPARECVPCRRRLVQRDVRRFDRVARRVRHAACQRAHAVCDADRIRVR